MTSLKPFYIIDVYVSITWAEEVYRKMWYQLYVSADLFWRNSSKLFQDDRELADSLYSITAYCCLFTVRKKIYIAIYNMFYKYILKHLNLEF